MNQSMITLQGYVGGEPVLRKAAGHSVASFRVAVTPRRLNRTTGEWADSPTQWYSVSAWRQLGENVAHSLRKGDPVVVHGRLMARSYINKDHLEVNTFDIEAVVVGHDLNRGVSTLVKNPPARTPAEPERNYDDQLDQHVDALERARLDWAGAPGVEPPGQRRGEPAEEAPAPAA